MSLARFAFQACTLNRSVISPWHGTEPKAVVAAASESPPDVSQWIEAPTPTRLLSVRRPEQLAGSAAPSKATLRAFRERRDDRRQAESLQEVLIAGLAAQRVVCRRHAQPQDS